MQIVPGAIPADGSTRSYKFALSGCSRHVYFKRSPISLGCIAGTIICRSDKDKRHSNCGFHISRINSSEGGEPTTQDSVSRKTNCGTKMPRTSGQPRSKMNPSGRYYIRLIPIHSGGQDNDGGRRTGLAGEGKELVGLLELGFTGIASKCPMNERWALGRRSSSSLASTSFVSASFCQANWPRTPFLRIRIIFRLDLGPVASTEFRLDCTFEGYASLLAFRELWTSSGYAWIWETMALAVRIEGN